MSAGPSLKENIEIIKNNQDKFVIFAVNPTVKLLAQQGITPDFIVDIEPIDNMSHFSGIDMSKQVLILEGFACNYLWRMKTKKKISYLSNDNFFNYFLRDCMKIEGHLETFGTVSYTALMSAFIMGFKKIILCGQDLAYKNGECYAKGSQYGEVECIYNNEVKKYEIRPKDENKYIKAFESEKVSGDVARRFAMNYIKFLNKNICTVKSQNGEDIPTQTGYALFIKQFSEAAEKLKVKRPEIELINSSIGGAQIDGFENKNLSDVILELESMDKIDVSTYKSHIDKNHIAEKLEKLIEQMKIFQKLSQDIELVCEKIIREIKNKKILTKDLEKLFNKYKEIYTNIMELSKKKDVSFVITAFMCRFIELLQIDYTKSPIELLQNFEKIKKYSEKNNVLLARDIAGLCNRKALILK